MATEIRVPTLGESVSEAIVGRWFKKVGDAVAVDEPLLELETDKVTVEVPAPAAGTLSAIVVADGATVGVGAVLGEIGEGAGAAATGGGAAVVGTASVPAMPPGAVSVDAINSGPERMAERPPAEQAAREQTVRRERAEARPDEAPVARGAEQVAAAPAPRMPPSPSARKMMEESGIEAGEIDGSGKRGQVLKGDVTAALGRAPQAQQSAAVTELRAPAAPQPAAEARTPAAPPPQPRAPSSPPDEAREERVRMTRLRQTIARRLKEAQNAAAMLTTFNDVDMSAVMALRRDYREIFEKKHGVRLGFMGFFVKACVQALKDVPEVNAEIDGADIVYKNYYHIGVAVGTEKGLVVPVVRDADTLSIAGIEKRINEFGKRARDGQLTIEEMQGGTFTISNGGVYGSLLSTPILNAPQSGILGMHRIEERPVVKDGNIVARPMMYLALSYDHRIVDGREAVTFLVRVKEAVEDPQRLVLDL